MRHVARERILPVLVATLFAAGAASAATDPRNENATSSTTEVTPAAPASPCAAAPYRVLDFWVGHWTVTNAKGQTAGESDIETILDDCVLLEHWYGSTQDGGRFLGKAFHRYDPRTETWQQLWVDNGPQSTIMIGTPAGGAMVYEWTTESKGKTIKHRGTLSARGSDEVRHFGEVSADDGKTWNAAYDLTYQRKKNS